MRAAPDQAARVAVIGERARNVVIDAGAGTGKTSTLVRRVVDLVAPPDDGDAFDIRRIAAITFTRRAAGELAQRIRRALACELRNAPSVERERRLRDGLARIDTAYIGTIHSFADRLLRELADRSGLGPGYEILADTEGLTAATTSILLQAASHGCMAAALAGTRVAADRDLADEVSETMRLAQHAGLLAHTKPLPWGVRAGLSSLVHEFCLHRDNPPRAPERVEVDLDATAAAIDALGRDFAGLSVEARHSEFGRWLGRYVLRAERALESGVPAAVYRLISRPLDGLKTWGPKKGTHCDGDADAFCIVKRLTGGRPNRGDAARGEVAYDRENLQRPLLTWLATRLVRTFPVVVALYEKIKAERQVVDHVDLLLQLRDLLRDDDDARRRCQERLDHVFVDEFQDTDPLQAEIVMFLVEDGPHATDWEDVVPRPGKLTIVGDPKQSIYRFRRADVLMYDRVRRKLLARPDDVFAVELAANFRSVPPLLGWLNARCEGLLGAPPDPDTRFDPEHGRVFHRPLAVGRAGDDAPAVEVLPIDPTVGQARPNVENTRVLAAEVTARWIRRQLDDPDATVSDPDTGKSRRLRPADIAVLTPVTTTLEPVFKELDRFDIPYAASGGRLFFNDPIHQSFLLALRGLAGGSDREIDDGAALAALYSRPVFDLGPGTVARGRSRRSQGSEDVPVSERGPVADVDEIVADLRKRRHLRSPGETARLLVERSALGRDVALRANGRQRLRRLYEMCQVVDEEAKHHGLDFDAVTRRLRDALEDPPQVDAPPPLGEHAVSVLTIHQAKGLEFPIVILWDCTAAKDPPIRRPIWQVDRDGDRWTIGLQGLVYNRAEGDVGQQAHHLTHELRRLFYVACTRARDRLVLTTTVSAGRAMHSELLPSGADEEHPAVTVHETHSWDEPAWADTVAPSVLVVATDSEDPYPAARDAWGAAREVAAKAVARPVPVSAWAQQQAGRDGGADAEGLSGVRQMVVDDRVGTPARQRPLRRGRLGIEFGSSVHAALETMLRHGTDLEVALDRSARAHGLREQLREAARADIERALEALREIGVVGVEGVVLRPEYAVAGPGERGELLVGVVDLVATDEKTLWVIDYKTDRPPTTGVAEAYPEYVAQVRAYAGLLRAATMATPLDIRAGLLFTAGGSLSWI